MLTCRQYSESGNKCYCGATLLGGATTGQDGCTTACAGASDQLCGGALLLGVYQSTTQPLPILANITTLYGLNTTTPVRFKGCFTDNSLNRTLDDFTFTSAKNMTVANCIRGCQAQGFSVSGVEYGTQCYCGTMVPDVSLLAEMMIDCEVMMCSGNTTEFCADSLRIAVYA